MQNEKQKYHKKIKIKTKTTGRPFCINVVVAVVVAVVVVVVVVVDVVVETNFLLLML